MLELYRKRKAFEAFHREVVPETHRKIKLDIGKSIFWRALVRAAGYASQPILDDYYTYFRENTYPDTTVSDAYTEREEFMTLSFGFKNAAPLVAFRSLHPRKLLPEFRDYVFVSLVSTVWNEIMDQREERMAMQELQMAYALENSYEIVKKTQDNVQAALEIEGFSGVQITLDQPSDKSFVILANSNGTAFIGSPTIDSVPGQALALWNAMGGYFCHQCQMNHYVRTSVEPFLQESFPQQVVEHFNRAKISLEQLENHETNHPGPDQD